MDCKNYNIKLVEGNAFALLFPLKTRTFVSREPIDEDIDILALTDIVVKVGGVVYHAEQLPEGLVIRDDGTLARGTYNIDITATYYDNAIHAAYFEALTIVAFNEQSDAQQYIQGSPIVLPAAYCVYSLTDAELEALKEEYREKNAQLDQAIADAEEAKREWEQKAADLDGVAQEETLTQGVQDIRDDISHIDIDTSTLAKETSVKDGNDTAISVSKEVRSEVGTGSDTAAESGTLFAVVKWVKDKVKSIGTDYAKQGSNASANISDIQALIGYTISEIDGV